MQRLSGCGRCRVDCTFTYRTYAVERHSPPHPLPPLPRGERRKGVRRQARPSVLLFPDERQSVRRDGVTGSERHLDDRERG